MIFSRYIRITMMLFALSIVGLFILKAYAGTLNSVPPITLSYWNTTPSKQVTIDVSRNIRVTESRESIVMMNFPSPDGEYWAQSDYRGGETIISVATFGSDNFRELGRYPSFMLGPFPTWASDSSGFYLLQRHEPEGINIIFIDRETGDVETLLTLETSNVPSQLTRMGGVLSISVSTLDVLFVNLETGDVHTLPSDQRHMLNPYPRTNYVIYSAGTDNTPNNIGALDELYVFDIETWETYTIDLRELPDTTIMNSLFGIPWRNDFTEFAVSLAEGGVALINIVTGDITYLDTDMTLHISTQVDTDEWFIGRITEDYRTTTLVAHHIPTGREVPLITDRPSIIAQMGVQQAPVGDDMVLITRTDREYLPMTHYDVFVRMVDLDTGDILHDSMVEVQGNPEPQVNFSYQWFFMRYGNQDRQ